MKKILLTVLKATILYFAVTEGQMAQNPHSGEYRPPAHFTPNASSAMRNFPSSRNSKLGNYSVNKAREGGRFPTDIVSNRNYPSYIHSNSNNPANYNSNNRNPSYYNSNNNNPAEYNLNNNNPDDSISNNNNPIYYNPYNRDPVYHSNNDNHENFNSNNNNPANFNSNNNNPISFNPNSNSNPTSFNPNNKNDPSHFTPNNNDNSPTYFNSNNNSPTYFNSNNHSPAYFNPNNNNPSRLNPNKNDNNPTYFNPNNKPTFLNPNNNNSAYFNSNKYPAVTSNIPLQHSGWPRNRHRWQVKSSIDEYPENDPHKGQPARDPYTSGYNQPVNFAPNNYNPANNRPPNQRPNFPFYIYYQTDPLKGGRIVCLFNAAKFLKSGFKPSLVPARLCTVVNYEFATLNSSTYEINPGYPDLDYGQKFYRKIVGLKHFNPYLKVMLSLGGWTDSTKKYSDLVASRQKVNNFIRKSVQFLKRHNFDGLDVAWEYPNCWKGALGISPEDKPNYATFLQKLRKAFDREKLLLSISVSSIKREIKAGYDGPGIAKAVHFINVMTYDMHGPWEHKTGHHSQFGKKTNDSDPSLNSKAAMEYWASIGVPKIKLNMGIATYATTFSLKDPNKHGLGAPAKGPGKPGALSHNGGTLTYREICQYVDVGNWTEEEDEDVGFYAYSGDQWAGYDHPLMVVRKTKWIADNGYGGLLIKDVSGDDYEKKCFTKRFPLIWIAGMEFRRRLEDSK